MWIADFELPLIVVLTTGSSYPQFDIRNPNLSWNSWQDSNPQPRRSKRRALPVALQEPEECRIANFGLRIPVSIDFGSRYIRNSKSEIRSFALEHRTGFEPVSQRWQRRVLNPLDQRCGKKRSTLCLVLGRI